MALNSQMSVVLFRRWNAAAGWEMNECQNLSYKIEDLIWKKSIARILRMCWWVYLIHLFAYFFQSNEHVLKILKRWYAEVFTDLEKIDRNFFYTLL